MDRNDNRDLVWKTSMMGCLGYVLGIAAGLIFAALLAGCTTTRYVPVVEHRTDTMLVNRTAHDTVSIRDSIFVSQWQQGDTMWVEKIRWQTIRESHTAHDTVYKSRTDSVPVPYPVEVEVEAQLTWWQKLKIDIAEIVLAVLAMAGTVWIIRKKFFS